MESVINEVIPQVTQQISIWIPVIVAIGSGTLAAVGSIFGNKKINDVNRQKYELLADNKIEIKFEQVKDRVNKNFNVIIDNQTNMTKMINFNTEITKEYTGRIELVEKLGDIKKEALNWSKDRGVISELVVIKANSMIEFFSHLLSEDISDMTVSNIKAEMQVQIVKVKDNWNKALCKKHTNFGEYFHKTSHNTSINSFFTDICWLLNPQRKINNINVKKELKLVCIKFFRHSLENLLASWESFQLKEKE